MTDPEEENAKEAVRALRLPRAASDASFSG